MLGVLLSFAAAWATRVETHRSSSTVDNRVIPTIHVRQIYLFHLEGNGKYPSAIWILDSYLPFLAVLPTLFGERPRLNTP